jgi:hypothetical protein
MQSDSETESKKKKLNKNKQIKRSDSYDSVNFNFEALDEYKKEAEESPLNENIFTINNNIIELRNIEEENFFKENFNKENNKKPKANNANNSNKIKINLKDKLILSDFEKYIKFGNFPFIILIHIFIVILTTLIVNIII